MASEAMTVERFGETKHKEPVQRIRIAGGGLRASILTYGAIVQDLRLDGHDAPLVLGFERLDDYLDHSLYFGAIVGRQANRIARGKFALDGERFETDRNDNGNTLHGGGRGLDRRVWRLADNGIDFVTLIIADPAGAMGFPGTLDVACTYRLKPPGTLSVELTATCDRPTLCNLAHHSYFNLNDGGSSPVHDHRLSISAEAYLPIDGQCLPTGAVLPVEGTPFDFVVPRTIRQARGQETPYDHNFCLSAARGSVPAGGMGAGRTVWC